jgi:hypothetical protein
VDRKRKNIPSGIRWKVFRRDGFRCIYCGATQETSRLVIDHGDPFSRGGDDSIDNYVTACRECNAGKRDMEAIPRAAWIDDDDGDCVTRKGVKYKSQLLADWGDALRHVSMWVRPGERRAVECVCGDQKSSVVESDFVCELTSHNYPSVHVVIVPGKDEGAFTEAEKTRIRDAAILGYREPTLILIGSPWFFYGLIVDDRHKGCPSGVAVDDCLAPAGREYSGGWYPDEDWSFSDPRSEFSLRPMCFAYRAWHMSVSDVAELYEKERRDGI